MTNDYSVSWYHSGELGFDEGYQKALALRIAVFVDEQGFQNEADEIDHTAYHLVMERDNVVIAVARIFVADNENEWHIGRVAVSESIRGTGLGRVIVAECERQIRALNGTSAVLSAQQRIQPFYEHCGYIVEGEPYYDEFCPHINMRKVL